MNASLPSVQSLELVVSASQNIVKREIIGETFLVPIRGSLANMQHLFVLENQVANEIWNRLDGQLTLADIHEQLLSLFEVEPEQLATDILQFVAELQRAGLVAYPHQ